MHSKSKNGVGICGYLRKSASLAQIFTEELNRNGFLKEFTSLTQWKYRVRGEKNNVRKKKGGIYIKQCNAKCRSSFHTRLLVFHYIVAPTPVSMMGQVQKEEERSTSRPIKPSHTMRVRDLGSQQLQGYPHPMQKSREKGSFRAVRDRY